MSAPMVPGRRTLPLLALFVAALSVTTATQSASLPDRETFLATARDNLTRSQRDQNRYAYKERRTEVHTNPFGRIGTGGNRTFDVHPGPEPGVWFRRLLERDGVAVRNAPLERQERRARDQAQRPSSMQDVIAALDLTLDRREMVEGRPMVVVRFAPRPNAKPQTREGRAAKVFKGEIWIDEAAHEVARIDGVAIDDMSYGGFVARINKGAVVRVDRRRIDDSIWLPVSVRVMGEGRAMLFRKLNIDYAIDWFDYRRVTP